MTVPLALGAGVGMATCSDVQAAVGAASAASAYLRASLEDYDASTALIGIRGVNVSENVSKSAAALEATLQGVSRMTSPSSYMLLV